MPFIARWPADIPAGREVETMLGAIDIMPSLVSLAGLRPWFEAYVPGAADPESGIRAPAA